MGLSCHRFERLVSGVPLNGARPLSNGIAGEALLKAELHGHSFLLRREPASGSGGVGHRWTV
jgi:hypothetical protein